MAQKVLPSLEGVFEVGAAGEPRLRALRCTRCGRVAFPPPVPRCAGCFEPALEEVVLSRRGTVHAYTEVHAAPPGFTPPYVLAYVDLPEGVRLLGQVEGDGELAPGTPVEMVTGVVRVDPDGTEWIGYRFRRARDA